MEKILCPVDLHTDTLNSLEAAAKVAFAHKAQLVLLHVFTEDDYEQALSAADGDMEEVSSVEKGKEIALSRLCDTLRDTIQGLQCVWELRQGSAVSIILELAHTLSAKLIVMGSHGVSSITEAMDGNHPVKVIESAPCPVLCVPTGASFESPAKVIYGSRLKAEDPDCLQRLIALLHPFSSRIEVVHVGQPTRALEQKWQEHERLIRSYVPYEKLSFTLFPWKKETYRGIDEFQLQARGQMLVLLTHQRNFLQRIFEKSVFKQFAYYSDFPVLVYLEDHLPAATAEKKS